MSKNIQKDLKKQFNFKYIVKCMKYFLPYKKLIALCVLLIIVSMAVGIATPKLDAFLTSTVLPNAQLGTFIWVIIGVTILNFSSIFAEFFKSKIIYKFGYDIVQKIRGDVYDKITALSFDFFDKNTTGSLIVKTTSYVDNISSFYTSYLFTFIEQTLRICMVVPFLFASSPIIATVGVGVIIPISIIVHFIMKLSNKRSKKYYESDSMCYSNMVENINGINTINSFNMQEKNCSTYIEQIKTNYKDWFSLSRAENSYYFAFNTIYNIAIAGIFILCFVLILRGEFTFAKYVAYIGYQGQLWGPFNYFVQLFNSFASLTGNLQQVFNTLDAEEKISDKNYAKAHTLKGNIEIKDLSFGYEEKLVLKDITLSIQAGKKTAICGLSNSGKSTLVELIGRLYEFNQGSITIDGIDVKSITQNSIHENIAIAQNNAYLFKDTIINNIKFGTKNVSDKKCIEICKKLGLHETIIQLGGYKKGLTENFQVNESTRQLINVARLMVSDKNIIIYDEALSSLSSDEEFKIIEILEEYFQDKTLIFVTNNMKALQTMDEIFYIKDRQICEKGNFENLTTSETIFKQDFLLENK